MVIQVNLLANSAQPVAFATGGVIAAESEDVVRQHAPVVESEARSRAPDGFFISPILRFDNQAFAVIFQVRDTETGDVTRQFPAESEVEALRRGDGGQAEEEATIGLGFEDERERTAEEGTSLPPLELATGPSSSPESDEPVAPAPTVGGRGEVGNGAPVVAGTVGPAPALAPNVGSVDVLV